MISRACYVQCDECGSPAQISTDDSKDARSIAKHEGFVRRGGRDICPHCAGRQGYFNIHGSWEDYTPQEMAHFAAEASRQDKEGES